MFDKVKSSHIELRKVIKQTQVHCPAQMSYSKEFFVFKYDAGI